MTFKRYNSASLTKFRKELIKEKGGSYQKILLENARDYENDAFVSWLDEQIVHHGNGITEPIEGDTDIALPDIPPKFSAYEFINPTIDTINNWFSVWKVLHVSDAANSSVWAYIARQMIAKEKLCSYDLMINTGKGDEFSGRSKIDNALNASGEERQKAMDKCVRNFLRHLCGLHEARSTRTIYQDCPFARAWWQCHIAESVENTDNQKIISLFHEKKRVWRHLSDKMAAQLTVLGDKNIRNGIIMFLKNKDAYHQEKPLKDLLTRVGIMTTWCALGYFPPEQVKMYVAELAASIEEQPLGESTYIEDTPSAETE